MYDTFEKAIRSKEILYFGVSGWQYQFLVNVGVRRKYLMQNSDVVNKICYIEKTTICRFAHF